MHTIALEYAAAEWPVFPCRPADDFDQDTGEVLPEKAPLISNGFRGATTNARVIGELWKRNPDAIIGVPTGERIGAWVLDIDIKTSVDGREWLAAMEAAHGKLPDTYRVSTANGGEHIFFNYAPGVRNRGKLGAGVDVRGEGGFVVAAGSVMGDGRRYTALNDSAIAAAPQWLLDLVLPPPQPEYRGDWQYQPGANDRYVNRAVESELAEVASCPSGSRGYQLNASAYALGTIVGAGALSRSEAEHGLWDAAVACGIAQKDGERETRLKIKRGLDAGEKHPRHIPEASQQADNTRLVDITRMIENGIKKAASTPATEPADEAAPAPTAPEPEQPAEPEKHDGLQATPFAWIDPATLARREFAFGTHYIRKYVSVTVSPGGLGKTSNSIMEALSMTSGKALAGTKSPNRMRVWLFNAEDPRDELERRIMAAAIHYHLTPADIEGHLFLDTGREQELVIAIDDRKAGVRIQQPVVEAVVAQIKANAIDVMIVDPFVSTHQVNENDNGAIDKVAKLWAHIADRTNCSIDIVHHLRKVSDREATVEDARGAVALIGAARSVRVLNRMSEEQAVSAGLSQQDRFSYFNVHQGKANLTRMSGAMDWRKLESVALGNGRGLSKPQDHAGVVTEWKWPTAEDVVQEVGSDVLENVKSVLAGASYKASQNSKQWAGEAIAYALSMEADDKAARKRCGTLLKAWLDSGDLVVVEERDPVTRHVGKFVRGG
jgi:hypothetical protein